MRGHAMVWVAMLAGCGRRGFGELPDGPAAVDAAGPDAGDLPGLIARYPMEDDPGDGGVQEVSGGGAPAVCATGVTCPTAMAGRIGNAVHFNGSSQVLRVIDPGNLTLPDAFTIAAWINADTILVDQVPFAKPHGASSNDTFALVLWTNQTCLETTTATGNQDVCHTVVPPEGTWVHLAGTWDGTTKQLFINGAPVAQLTPAATVVFDSHDVLIGSDENGGSTAFPFAGGVDDVQIYDRALSPAEVAGIALITGT